MDDRNGFDSCPFQQAQALLQIEKRISLLVVDIELEEVMRQLAIEDRMPGVNPLTEQNESVLKLLFQQVPLDGRPLLEQIILGVHSLGDEMAPALQSHFAVVREMNSNIRPVDLLLDDQR